MESSKIQRKTTGVRDILLLQYNSELKLIEDIFSMKEKMNQYYMSLSVGMCVISLFVYSERDMFNYLLLSTVVMGIVVIILWSRQIGYYNDLIKEKQNLLSNLKSRIEQNELIKEIGLVKTNWLRRESKFLDKSPLLLSIPFLIVISYEIFRQFSQ